MVDSDPLSWALDLQACRNCASGPLPACGLLPSAPPQAGWHVHAVMPSWRAAPLKSPLAPTQLAVTCLAEVANVRNKAELLDYLRRRERQGEGYAALGELADAYPGARQDLEVGAECLLRLRRSGVLSCCCAVMVRILRHEPPEAHVGCGRTCLCPGRSRALRSLGAPPPPPPHRLSKPSGWWSACRRQTPLVKKCFTQWTPRCEWRWMWTCRWVLVLFCSF